jgi:hypothetical protein
MSVGDAFKTCPKCGHSWATRAEFLDDPGVQCIGYQVDFGELIAGIFLFNHSCWGTLGIEVSAFRDLYDGPVFQNRATGTDECPKHCLHENDLEACGAKCECAFVREILQIIRPRANLVENHP